jgi:hypothetical protein
MKQAISGAMADRKGTMKMGVKNQPKNDGTIIAAINHKTTVRLTSRAQYQASTTRAPACDPTELIPIPTAA